MPKATPVKRIYAIGDIHGYIDALEGIQRAIEQDISVSGLNPKTDNVMVVYLGDYIDRGPESKNVIENLLQQKKKKDGVNRIFIAGNHDLCLVDFADGVVGPDTLKWFKYGGLETLKSYGVALDVDSYEAIRPAQIESLQNEFKKSLPAKHKKFISSLPLYHIEGDYFFVHAGVDPEKGIKDQIDNDLIYIREPFLSWKGEWEKVVVHGHTIAEQPEIMQHRIGIDVGVYENARLGCAVLGEEEPRFLYAPTRLKQYDDPKP